MDENDLMMRVIDGEVGEFGILYQRYKKRLYGYFFKLTRGDQASSEDLVHTVFYKAIRYRKSYKGTGSFAKWIFSIAHNTGVDHRRKTNQVILDNDYAEYRNGYHVNNDLERTESLEILDKALARLDRDDQEILLLGKIRELRYSEIAEITGSTENAVKTRICRALKKLRTIYIKLESSKYERERLK